MKKKSFIVSIITLLIALFAFACGSEVQGLDKVFDPYDGFDGIDKTAHLEVDEYVTLDGVLDEEIWANSKTAVTVQGVKGLDEEKWGHREMTCYTYIGEKAVYFAFDVTDPNLYYNKERAQGASSTVEVYFTSAEHTTLEPGCISVRASATPEGMEPVVMCYIPNPEKTDWVQDTMRGKYAGGVKVDGNVATLENPKPDMSNNVGYVVEMAFDWSVIADSKPEAIQYAAAFCQASGLDTNRLGNSFIPGTSHVNVSLWKLVNNDGVIADKNAYFDSTVVVDDGVTLDGNFTEDVWAGSVERKYVTTYKNKNNENIELAFKTASTEKGLYIGLESNDSTVFVDEATLSNNTGVEILIAANNTKKITKENVVQLRLTADGKTARYRGDQYAPADGYPYRSDYFKLKAGTRVIGGEFNSATADGWAGEIFIPWNQLGVTSEEGRSRVAILPCMYLANETKAGASPDGKRRAYVSPSDGVFGNGSARINPQEEWFVFENGKPVYDEMAVTEILLDNTMLENGYYVMTVSAVQYDDVADLCKEVLPVIKGATFDIASVDGVVITDNNDGTYQIKIGQWIADQFAEYEETNFTANGEVGKVGVHINSEFNADGKLDEPTYADLDKLTVVNTLISTVSADFTVALENMAMYLYMKVTDANFTAYKDTQALGLEAYFNFGPTLSSKNTYQIRLHTYHNTGYENRVYVYKDVPDAGGWSWDGGSQNDDITRVFVDNGDGTYNLEARIPYSVFNLKGKPEWVEICPAIKYYAQDRLVTAFYNYAGDAVPSRDQGLYMRFTDEVGFTPTLYAFDADGEAINSITVYEGINVENEKHVGSISLAYLYGGRYPVVDATFGDKTEWFTSNGDGTYSYAIPTSAFDGVNAIEIDVKTALYDGRIIVEKQVVGNVYTTLDDGVSYSDKMLNTWLNDRTVVNGEEYYVLTAKTYLDGNYQIPLPYKIVEAQITIDGVEGMVIEKDDNVYTLLIPVSQITRGEQYEISVTADGYDGATIKMFVNELSDEDKTTITSSALVYFDFNGNVTERISGLNTSFAVGSAKYDESNQYFMTNQYNRMLTVDGLDLANKSFTVSVDMDGDAMKNTYYSHYGNIIFSNTNVDNTVDGINRVAIMYRGMRGNSTAKGTFVLYLGTQKYFVLEDFASLYDEINGWTNFTFTFDMSVKGQGTITMYINGGYIGQRTLTGLGDDFYINTTKFGVGGPMCKDTGAYTKDNADIAMDNFAIFEGIVDDYTVINGLKSYYPDLVKKADFKVDDVTFNYEQVDSSGAFETTITVNAGHADTVVTGATLVNAPSGVTLSEVGDGQYKLILDAQAVESAKEGFTVTYAIDGIKKSFKVLRAELTAEEKARFIANTAVYMDLNGNVNVYGTANATATVRRDRDESTRYANGAYNMNMYKRALSVSGVTLGSRNAHSASDEWGSFTISMDINGTDLFNTSFAGYGIPLFTTSRTDAKSGFGIYFRGANNGKNGTSTGLGALYLKDHTTSSVNFPARDAVYAKINGRGMQNWTFIFDRRVSGQISVTLYIDGELMNSTPWVTKLSDDLDISAGSSAFGIGAGALEDDVASYPHGDVYKGDGSYENKDSDVKVANYIFYNGIMSQKEIQLKQYYYDALTAKN